jgi:N-ethylmaleimide reductase
MSKLYTPVQIGAIDLDHRIVQAPLTRLRSDQPGDVPSAMMVEYCGQRASRGGLQIAEATPVAVQGRGYLGAPGIYSDAQIEGWRKVRQSHVSMTGGTAPLAPSAVRVEDLVSPRMAGSRLRRAVRWKFMKSSRSSIRAMPTSSPSDGILRPTPTCSTG